MSVGNRLRSRNDGRANRGKSEIRNPDGSLESPPRTAIYSHLRVNRSTTMWDVSRSLRDYRAGNPYVLPQLRYEVTMSSEDMAGFTNPDWGALNYENTPPYWDPLEIHRLVPSVESAQRKLLAVSALEAFTDQVPQEVDVVNFLRELREISELVPTLKENMSSTVSGGFLSYQFGWLPFLDDLKALRDLSGTVRRRIQWLRETYGKVTKLGYSRPLEGNDSTSVVVPSVLQDMPTPWGYSRPSVEYVRTSHYHVGRAGGKFRHRLERLDGVEGLIRAYTSALGLTNPAAVAWEMIPFSFVADWFTQIGTQTRQIALNPYPGEWEVWDVSHSITSVVTFDVFDRTVNFGPGGSIPRKPKLGSGRIVRYERNPGLPVEGTVLTDTTLDTRQQLLVAALLGAQLK